MVAPQGRPADAQEPVQSQMCARQGVLKLHARSRVQNLPKVCVIERLTGYMRIILAQLRVLAGWRTLT
jgi:hypothetical protein